MGAICVFSLMDNKYFIIRIDNSNLKYINNFLFVEDRHELNNFLPEDVLNNEWLTKYKIIQLDLIQDSKNQSDEELFVKRYMRKYGINNVRGGNNAKIKLDDNFVLEDDV
jgi:hypothetical protein